MNYYYKTFFILGFLLIFSFFQKPVFGQITIDSNEYNITFGTEQTFYAATDTLGAGFPVNVGTTGGSQTWNFSQTDFPGGLTATSGIVDPAGTPFSSDFPTANHAFFFNLGDTAASYAYFNLTNSALFELGSGVSFGGFTSVTVNDPPVLAFPFPATLNTTWDNTNVTHNDIGGGVVFVDSTVENFVIDAWGSITVPFGTFNCLRLRIDEFEFLETTFNGTVLFSDTSTTISYDWIVENHGLIASVSSKDGETNPNFTMASDVSFRVPTVTGIEDEVPRIIEGFELAQNYPNPFNPSTTITYELPRTTTVDLSVFDISGRKVATLVSGQVAAGEHHITFSAENLPSGIYLYRLKGQGVSLVKRMVLLK